MFRLLLTLLFFFVTSSVQADDFDDIFAPREKLKPKRLGANAFVNDPQFGSISSQFKDLKSNLGIRYVRVLFAWNDQVQPTPSSEPDFSFYDEIVSALPKHMRVLVILTGLPSWMSDSTNWINNDPSRTFLEQWVRVVVTRYRGNKKIRWWQLWNEPNNESNSDNQILGFDSSALEYLEMLAEGYSIIKDIQPKDKVVNAATTAINQGFPETLNYNQDLLDGGVEEFVDIFATHFYGTGILTFLTPGGGSDLLNTISKPIWITESGSQGLIGQLEYAERYFSLLFREVPNVKRVFIYQYTDGEDQQSSNYGLRTPFGNSDLYEYLEDN